MGLRGRRVPAAGLAVLGLLLLALGMKASSARVHPVGQAFFSFDRPGINAHNSPAAAVDPTRPGVAAVADRIDTPRFSCSVALSSDAGRDWDQLALPLPAEAPNCYWPDVAYDGEGRLLVLYTATGGRLNLPVGVWLQRFVGTAPDGPAVPVAGAEAFQAHMAVDGSAVLVAWLQAGPATVDKGVGFSPAPNPIMAARSDDGGRTFGAPVTVSEPDRLVALPSVLLGPGGRAVVGALDLGGDVDDYEGRHEGQGGAPHDGPWRVVAWSSRDGGATFAPASVVADDLVPPQRIIVNLGPVPGFAWDPSRDRLYATWDAGRGDARDVFVARSDDGGTTWSRPVAVVRRRGTQTLPAVAVAPDGRVDVLFYDRSRDRRKDVLTEVAMASSWDGGRTFTTGEVSDGQFDSRIGFGSAQGIPLLGSQLAVLSDFEHPVAFWSDTRRTNQDDNAQELALALVDADEGGRRPWPVALAGLAVLAGAAALGPRAGRGRKRTA